MRLVWINLYLQGYYHRDHKPGTLPFHAGDTYATYGAAQADIDKDAPFIATFPVMLTETDFWAGRGEKQEGWDLLSTAQPYGPDSQPKPLRETRGSFGKAREGWDLQAQPNWPIAGVLAAAQVEEGGSLDTSESEAVPLPAVTKTAYELVHEEAERVLQQIDHPSPTTVADWINMCRRPA